MLELYVLLYFKKNILRHIYLSKKNALFNIKIMYGNQKPTHLLYFSIESSLTPMYVFISFQELNYSIISKSSLPAYRISL